VAPPVFKTGLAGNTLAGRFDSFPPPPQCRRCFCGPRFQGARMALAMRWAKRFLKRLALSVFQASSPEERPAEGQAPAIQVGVAGALCTRCRRALVRNLHQVRVGRARKAPR
jgi:hypothetical protein